MKPAFNGNFGALVREMAAAARQLEDDPEDTGWPADALDTLESVRHAALKLARAAEAILEDA